MQKYKRKDGSILREFRPEQEVFAEKNIEALRTSPVTNGHPPEMVTPENSKRYMVGFPSKSVQKIDNDGPEKYLETWLTVTDKDTIAAIKAGKAEVSNGYSVDMDWTPGIYKGEPYDAIQRKIVNNHIAIVWHARGGSNVRLHLDSDDDAINYDGEDMKKEFREGVIDMDQMREDLLRSATFRKKLEKARRSAKSKYRKSTFAHTPGEKYRAGQREKRIRALMVFQKSKSARKEKGFFNRAMAKNIRF